jgi:hypothetical protein
VLTQPHDSERDRGQLALLVIGYVAIAGVLIVAGIDASKVFLARRALSSAADAAALAAAQAVDRAAIYAGDAGGCGALLPLDDDRAGQLAGQSVADDLDGLRQTFRTVDPPDTLVASGTVTVHLSGDVGVPFGGVLAMLVPGHGDGLVHVDVSASAQSPLSTPSGC